MSAPPPMRRWFRRFSPLVFTLAWVCAFASRACAHDPFEMTADTQVTSEKIEMKVVMPRGTAFDVIRPDLPAGTRFEPEKLESQLPLLERGAGNIFEISSGEDRLEVRNASAHITQEEDVEIVIDYAPPKKSPLRIRALQVQKLGYGYGATVMVMNGARRFLGSKMLMGDDATLEVPLPDLPGAPATDAMATAAARPTFSFKKYLVLGIEHILTGYDHLLFLAALLVACRRLRTILVIITCFTLAHSITLGLAALNVINVSPRIIEPLIAATIVYVAVENLFLRGREPHGRGWLTFTFGLIHGFGFASALRSTGLGTDAASLALPLVSFNLGVEIGQITFAAVCLPLWWRARTASPVEKYGALAVSSIVALAGLYWFLERTVL